MSQIRRLVDERRRAEDDFERRVGDAGELHVPWQVCTVDGSDLTVHYFTNALNVFVGLSCFEDGDSVEITVVERCTSNKLPGQHRMHTASLSNPLHERRIVDGSTGRRREVFTPDVGAGWVAFDHAAAAWLLAGDGLASLQGAAGDALADRCQSVALERIAAGGRDLSAVYRERGLRVPDQRAAAKLVVDAALAEAFGEEPHPESIAFALDAVASSGRMHADQRDELAELLAIYREIQRTLGYTSDADAHMDRFLARAREMHARGGLGS